MNVEIPISFLERESLVKLFEEKTSASRKRSANSVDIDTAQDHLDNARRCEEIVTQLKEFGENSDISSVTFVPLRRVSS